MNDWQHSFLSMTDQKNSKFDNSMKEDNLENIDDTGYITELNSEIAGESENKNMRDRYTTNTKYQRPTVIRESYNVFTIRRKLEKQYEKMYPPGIKHQRKGKRLNFIRYHCVPLTLILYIICNCNWQTSPLNS